MTEDESTFRDLAGESSRRSFVKTGVLASGALALGLSGTGTVAAQDGETAFDGLMFANDVYPGSTFEVVSGSIDWFPVETDQGNDDFLAGDDDQLLFDNPDVFANYDTRVIQYDYAAASYSLLFPGQSVDIQQGQRYRMSSALGTFGTQQAGVEDDLLFEAGNDLGLVRVQFQPIQGGDGGAGNQTAGDQTAGNETGGNQTDG